jgi:L-iditol 2-dehydrogenase
MKALNLHAVNDLRYEEVAQPVPQKDEVLLKVRASGICGSDLQRVFDKGTYSFPTIPGHEFAGEIVEANDEQMIGKKAAVFPLIPCFKCESCQIGEYAQCIDYDYYGSRRNGGFAEYITVKYWNLVSVPDKVSYEEAAMCEPASVALHAIRQAGVEVGDTVAIFGAGPIGIMLGQWALAWGAFKVILVDIEQTKIDFAIDMGFENAINALKFDPVAEIRRISSNSGANICIEGAGVSATLEQAIKAVKNFGTVVALGNPLTDMKLTQKGYWEILRKQITLRGTWNSSYNRVHNDWRTTIRAMEAGKLNVKPLISHRFGFSDNMKAFKVMRERKEYSNKVMFIN